MSTQSTPVVNASFNGAPSREEYEAMKERLRVLSNKGSILKVTAKGAIYHCGLSANGFGVTLTKLQWMKIIKTVKSGELEQFIAENDHLLFQGVKATKEQE